MKHIEEEARDLEHTERKSGRFPTTPRYLHIISLCPVYVSVCVLLIHSACPPHLSHLSSSNGASHHRILVPTKLAETLQDNSTHNHLLEHVI